MLIGLSKIHGDVGLCTHLVSSWLRDKPVSSKLGTYGTQSRIVRGCGWRETKMRCIMQNLGNVFEFSVPYFPRDFANWFSEKEKHSISKTRINGIIRNGVLFKLNIWQNYFFLLLKKNFKRMKNILESFTQLSNRRVCN